MYQGVLFCTFMRVIVMIFNHKDVSHRVYVDFFLLNIKIMEMYVRYVLFQHYMLCFYCHLLDELPKQ